MRFRFLPRVLGTTVSLLGAWALATPQTAAAQLAACGNIDVEADATCEVQVSGGCTTQCTPVSFQAACAAELEVDCRGGCTGSVTADCMASCSVSDCMAHCSVDPGMFDCHAECRADVHARCDASCTSMTSDSQAHAECQASCDASFAAECTASCEGTPPTASCEAQCNASCEAHCRAESTLMCQVDCQSRGYVDCEASLMGGCRTACEQPEGALFCDGQYVDHGGNAQACIDALDDWLSGTVDISARASASCSGGSCMASASAACTIAPGRADASWALGGGGLVLALVVVARRRRR